MTDSPAPMTEKEKLEEQVRSRISHMVDEAQDRMEDALFDRFDKLKKSGINDDDVIHALRRNGEADLAEAYIEWGGCVDPDVDPTPQGPELVTDPGDSPSYATHPLNTIYPLTNVEDKRK